MPADIPGRPGTLAHFKRWAKTLVLDTGDPWILEPFQTAFLRDVLHGHEQCWLIVPEGNGKTTLVAGIVLYRLEYRPHASIPVAASSREQAEILYRQAEGFVLRTARLHEPMDDPLRELRGKRAKQVPRLECQEGFRRIKHFGGGRLQVFAADDRTGDGVIPSDWVIDELHRQRNLKLLRTWSGKHEKRQAQGIVISTAGEPGSEFEDTRAKIVRDATEVQREGAFIRAVSQDTVLHDWAVRDHKRADDMAVVAAANPRKAITTVNLRQKRDKPEMTDEHWQRFTCNIATRESGQAITPEEWDVLREEALEPDREAWNVGWLDLGWKIDCTALGVVVWEGLKRRVVPAPVILRPPVDESNIVVGLLAFQEEYGPEGWVYDPNAGGQQMAQLLEKGEHPLQFDDGARERKGLPPLPKDEDGDTIPLPPLVFIEHSQDNGPMALAASRLDEAIRNRWIVHDGDEGLRAHALNAVQRTLGAEKWRYDRPPDGKGERRAQFPNDALIGLAMGHSTAVAEQDQEEAVPLVHRGR